MRALGSTFAGGSLKNRHMRTRPASYPLREINTMRAIVLLLLLACGLSACSPEGAPVAEAQYSAKIVGDWQGTVGDSRETISFNADGGFVSQVRRQGFISNTLGQGVTGTVRGTWAIKGRAVTLSISSAEDVRVLNGSTTSTIEAFKPNELVVKSNTTGETSTFVRTL